MESKVLSATNAISAARFYCWNCVACFDLAVATAGTAAALAAAAVAMPLSLSLLLETDWVNWCANATQTKNQVNCAVK